MARFNTIVSVIIILMLGTLMVLVVQLPERITKPTEAKEGWTPSQQLDYANMLLAKGLKLQAAAVLEKYIETADASNLQIANICYRLGNIYMDTYQYEKALAFFYRSEMLDKATDFAQERSQKIVEALENLGLVSEAKYELAKRTSLSGASSQEAGKNGEIVARIGKRKITQAEIDKELKVIPEGVRKDLESGSKRLEFIRNYVATEVLYEKAKRLGIDKDPQIRQTLERTKKQLVVQNYLNREIKKEFKIDQEDVKNYYKANQDRYTEPAKIKLRYVEFNKDAEKEDALKKIQENKGVEVKGWITQNQTYISGIGEAKEAIKKLFLKKKGEYSEPLKIKDKFYIFFIEDKHPERIKAFAEVKDQVEYEYKTEKEQRITDSLLKKALEEQEVEIYYKPKDEKGKTN